MPFLIRGGDGWIVEGDWILVVVGGLEGCRLEGVGRLEAGEDTSQGGGS